MNERIVESAYAAMRGEIDIPRVTSGYCLRTVRKTLEDALGWEDEGLYARFPNKLESVTPHPRPFWSRDIQRSFREAGWGIPPSEVQPGDVLTYWKAARNTYGDYVGHIALAMPGRGGKAEWVFENVAQKYRDGMGAFASGALSLMPLERWSAGREIEAFRIPEDMF